MGLPVVPSPANATVGMAPGAAQSFLAVQNLVVGQPESAQRTTQGQLPPDSFAHSAGSPSFGLCPTNAATFPPHLVLEVSSGPAPAKGPIPRSTLLRTQP